MSGDQDLEIWLCEEGRNKYREAVILSTDASKNDPETEPYKSKYAAREILLQLERMLESFVSGCSVDDYVVRLLSLQSVIEYDLALNYIETEEKGTGEGFLNSLREKFGNFRLRPEFCSVVMKCYQQLGILWSDRGEFQKSLQYFSDAEKLYKDYSEPAETPPMDTLEVFTASKEADLETLEQRKSKFENLHTHTLFYITQVYKNIGDNKKSSIYCHNTLHRQLLTKLYDPVDWAVNCATLSQYHLTQEDYKSARHCLACASCVIAECPTSEPKEPIDPEVEGEDERRVRERVPQARANVALCWSKYCLDLLKNSSQRIGEDAVTTEGIANSRSEKEDPNFDSLDVAKWESAVSCQIAKNFDEARCLFLAGQQHLNMAMEFYKLDGYVTNHVEIVQDHSQLYRHLAMFDRDLERQCKMCKRRVDMLAGVLVELNPQHYLLICRQLIFEIATIYGDMADFKMAIIHRNEPQKPSAHQVKKVNSLLGHSAKFYTSFIDSLKQEGKLPEKYDASVLRVALLAHLHLARTRSKRFCASKEERLGNVKSALDLYKYVVDYCDRDEEGARNFKEELQACREMVDLLPIRLNRIGQGLE